MMMEGDGRGGWIVGGLIMLPFWRGLVALVVFFVQGVGPGRPEAEEKHSRIEAREIMAERFARGEISEDEFVQRRGVLEHTPS